MKTDKLQNWEYRFFEGDQLTSEEEKWLKEQSDNPYFSALEEEKKETMDLSFEDFLSKVEEKEEEIPIVPLKPTLSKHIKTYWAAASVILFSGLIGGYLFVNEQDGQIEKQPKPSITIVNPKLEQNDSVSQEKSDEYLISEKKNDTKVEVQHQNIAKHITPRLSPKSKESYVTVNDGVDSFSEIDYAPILEDYQSNYVIINGRPVTNEQEAISLTEDALNYLGTNVKQTIDHAESVKTLSLDF